ncbi:MAG: hypothetical protein ABIK89_14905 [Planctomycetota bacterium]
MSNAERAEGKFSSSWVVMTRRPENLGTISDEPKWEPLPAHPEAPLWSDDFSNILAVLTWR